MERHFCDGHTETWWTADARLGGYGPDSPRRLVVATTDPARRPERATWYLATDLPHPDAPHATSSLHPPADLAEIARLHGLPPWIEQSYEQIKDELGRADFQVRSDRAVRRHPTLVNRAFSLCWGQWFASVRTIPTRSAHGPRPGGGPREARFDHIRGRPPDGTEAGRGGASSGHGAVPGRGCTGRQGDSGPRRDPLAALYSGSTVVRLRPDFPLARTRQMIDAAGVTTLIGDDQSSRL